MASESNSGINTTNILLKITLIVISSLGFIVWYLLIDSKESITKLQASVVQVQLETTTIQAELKQLRRDTDSISNDLKDIKEERYRH